MVRNGSIALALFASSVAIATQPPGPLESILREIARKRQGLASLIDPAIGLTLVEDALDADGSTIRAHARRLCGVALDKKIPLLERDLRKQLRRGGFQTPREEESEPTVMCDEHKLVCDVWIDGEPRGTWLFFTPTASGPRLGALASVLSFQERGSPAARSADKALRRALATPCPAQ